MSGKLTLEVDLTNATPATLDGVFKLIGYLKGDPDMVALTQKECQNIQPPVSEESETEPAPAPVPAPASAPQAQPDLLEDHVEYTLSDVRVESSQTSTRLKEAGADGRAMVFAVMAKHGGKTLASLPKANYAAYIEELKTLSA